MKNVSKQECSLLVSLLMVSNQREEFFVFFYCFCMVMKCLSVTAAFQNKTQLSTMKEKMGSNCEAITKESLLQRNYFGIMTQLKTTTSSSNQRKRLHKQAARDVGDSFIPNTLEIFTQLPVFKRSCVTLCKTAGSPITQFIPRACS